jgi:hypothetical protein
MAALIGGLFLVVSLLLNGDFSTTYELLFSSTENAVLYIILFGRIRLMRKRPCGRARGATLLALQHVHCLNNRITVAERVA